jgi:hypothetical protein
MTFKWITILVLMRYIICVNSFAQMDTIALHGDTAYHAVNNAINYSDSQETMKPHQPKTKTFDCIGHVPNNLWQIAKAPFQKKNLGNLALVAGATALFVWQDHHLMDGISATADRMHLDRTTNYKPVLRIKDVVLLKAPGNINSALVQLGDGGTSLLLAGGLFVYGHTNKDQRAVQAASDVTETVISMALATKMIKWAAGRQEPSRASEKASWKPFTSLKDFWDDKSNYDAFASGHVATLTATVTVLGENYPEKRWIKPIGYSLVGMMAFALSNTKMHWVGDYPLAFALGYLSGKVTAGRHMIKAFNKKHKKRFTL